MFFREFSLLLLAFIYWYHRNSYIIAIQDNLISNIIVKILTAFPIISMVVSFCIFSILLLIWDRWNRLRIVTGIISGIIILIAAVLYYNSVIHNESTYIILFEISHPLSLSDKRAYLESCLMEHATQYLEPYYNNPRYRARFHRIITQLYSKVDLQTLVQLNKVEIENLSKKLVSETIQTIENRSAYLLLLTMTILFCLSAFLDWFI
jgi:hypothetical protein